MQRTKIEWCDYTINPVKGLCPMACSYCYARRMYKRFKWNPEIRFDATVFNDLPLKPARIFVGSTIELFLPQFSDWLTKTFDLIAPYKWLTFIFLTKQPQNLIKWSPFPQNCWVGTSVCNDKMLDVAVDKLEDIQAKIKFISFEPLLEKLTLSLDYAFYYSGISWVICGQQTPANKKTTPKKEWIDEIIDAADKASVPVFLKDNLRPVLKSVYGDKLPLRQEFPNLEQ